MLDPQSKQPTPSSSPDDLARYGRDLRDANGFLSEALDANRQGRLTSEQHALTANKERRDRIWYLLVGVGIVGIAVNQVWGNPLQPQDVGWYVAIAAGVFMCVLGLGWDLLGIRRDLRSKHVIMWQGCLSRRESSSVGSEIGTSMSYYYVMNRQSFSVQGERAFALLDERLTYRIYFLPTSKTLVNIEPVAPLDA